MIIYHMGFVSNIKARIDEFSWYNFFSSINQLQYRIFMNFLCSVLIFSKNSRNTFIPIIARYATYLIRPVSRILLKASKILLAFWWYIIILWCGIRYSFVSVEIIWFQKWVPSSLVKLSAHPNHKIILKNIKWVAISVEQSLKCSTLSYRVK